MTDQGLSPRLRQWFGAHPRVAVAFSGGVDSAYLLYAARACGVQATAYYLSTAFQPEFEKRDARRIARELSTPLVEIPLDVLQNEAVRQNPPERCYHCKRALFSALWQRARADGYETLLDGTNASDEAADRPGMRALGELQVLSPLRQCGLGKADIRAYSRQAGLFTADKPAYACLATRIPTGQAITREALQHIEAAEAALMELGFCDLRVRVDGSRAKIQLPDGQLERAVVCRESIWRALSPYFQEITLDLKGR